MTVNRNQGAGAGGSVGEGLMSDALQREEECDAGHEMARGAGLTYRVIELSPEIIKALPMKAQSLSSLFLTALLLAVLPAIAAEPPSVRQGDGFMRQAVQAAPLAQSMRHRSWEQGAASHHVAPLAGQQRDVLFTLGGIRFNAIGGTSAGTAPLASRAAEAGLHVSLFYLLNAFNDQNPLQDQGDYVVRLHLPF